MLNMRNMLRLATPPRGVRAGIGRGSFRVGAITRGAACVGFGDLLGPLRVPHQLKYARRFPSLLRST
jgi:hypothetical protein